MKNRKTIIPIASGKGGVGKSLLTANLALSIAQLGFSTTAVDLDLGGSNLHTYLGIPNTNPGIGDFLKGKKVNFEALSVKTGIPNLSFIPGDGKTPFMANIPFTQRVVLLEKIQHIQTDFILLDLGAGTSFNTLNFFGLSNRGAIVTTFETPAIMNFLVFLRNFMFRVLSSLVRDNRNLFADLIKAYRQPITTAPLTMDSLLERDAKFDRPLAEKARRKLSTYRPRIIFNMGENPEELEVIQKIDNTLRQSLLLEADFFGYIFFDDHVRQAAKKGEILLTGYPESLASKSIAQLAKRIVKNWRHNFNDSASLLKQDTEDRFAKWKHL